MAIDLFIFGVLLISFLINLVALGVFWVTPSLRTTGNRFTINLLIINLTGCLILTPTLLLDVMSRVDSRTSLLRNTMSVDSTSHKHMGEQEGVILNVTAEVLPQIPNFNETRNNTKQTHGIRWLPDTSESRYWSIDLAAALGSLAVFLIVADTWCAITDPLRYHSRISGMKTWIFIVISWLVGFIFAGLSAFRYMDFQKNVPIASTKSCAKGIYEIAFASFYFVIIIMLPFGFVCGMYWRIFKEARGNGLRMRQNGSSPLLQSSLNLNNQQLCECTQLQSIICNPTQDILLGVQLENSNKTSSTSTFKDIQDSNYNIVFTVQVPGGEIKQNFSTRKLPLLSPSSFNEETILKGVRQANSSSNLKPYKSGNAEYNSSHLLPHKPLNVDQYQIRLPNLQSYGVNKRNQDTTKTLSYMTSLKHRISNASSLFRYREESRAARISILVVIMFLVSYLPYGLLVLFQSIRVSHFPYSNQMAILMILLANVSSPFIFAYRNKRVRRGLNQLFGLEIRCKLRNKCQSYSSDRKMLEEIGVRKIHSNIQNV